MSIYDQITRWTTGYDPDLPTDIDELYELLERHCEDVRNSNQRSYEAKLDWGYTESELASKARQRKPKPDPYVQRIWNQIRAVKINYGAMCGMCNAEPKTNCTCPKEPIHDVAKIQADINRSNRAGTREPE